MENVFKTQIRDYAFAFFLNLSPSFLARQKDLDRYKHIYDRVRDSVQANFIKLLRIEIDFLQSLVDKANQIS